MHEWYFLAKLPTFRHTLTKYRDIGIVHLVKRTYKALISRLNEIFDKLIVCFCLVVVVLASG